MSVQPIGGTHPALTAQALQTTVRSEAAEQKGAPDRDGDSDDSAVKVELTRQS